MSNFTIRPGNESDFDRIFEIWLDNQKQAIGKQPEPSKVETLKAELLRLFTDTPLAVFYIAESESKQILGWQALLPLLGNPLLSGYIAQSSTYVDRQYYNKDVATKLVEFAVHDARRLGIEHIYGWVKSDNEAVNKIARNFTNQKCFIHGPRIGNIPDFNLYIIETK